MKWYRVLLMFVLRMSVSGGMGGGAAGAIYGSVAPIVGTIIGGFFGASVGFLVSVINGLLCGVITLLFFPSSRNLKYYSLVIGFICVVITFIGAGVGFSLFFGNPFTRPVVPPTDENFFFSLYYNAVPPTLIAVVCAWFVSQYMAQWYKHERYAESGITESSEIAHPALVGGLPIIVAIGLLLAYLVFSNTTTPVRFPQFAERRVTGPGAYSSLRWSPDARYLTFTDIHEAVQTFDSVTFTLWDGLPNQMTSGSRIPTQPSYITLPKQNNSSVLESFDKTLPAEIGVDTNSAFALSPDKKAVLILAGGGDSRLLILYDETTRQVIRRIDDTQWVVPPPSFLYVYFGNYLHFLQVGKSRWTVGVYTAGTGTQYREGIIFLNLDDSTKNVIIFGQNGSIRDVAVAPDFSKIAYVTMVRYYQMYVVVADLPAEYRSRLLP